jgi:hypothetical protein
VSKIDYRKTLYPRRRTQSKIAAQKGPVLGPLVTPHERGGQLEGVRGTQIVSIETGFGKVPQVVGRLYFAPNPAKHHQPTVCHFKILRRQKFLLSPPA